VCPVYLKMNSYKQTRSWPVTTLVNLVHSGNTIGANELVKGNNSSSISLEYSILAASEAAENGMLRSLITARFHVPSTSFTRNFESL